jgi:hypothetical protein
MVKLLWMVVGLLASHFAFADAPQSCPQAIANQISCVAGEKMLCNKEFDPAINVFKYEWHALNEMGQTFDVFSPYYKKLAGYTPAKCNDSIPVAAK